MPEPVLAFDRFSYRYPGTTEDALTEVSLAIEAGELVVLAGRSGSGKTTLLRAACGLVPHFHGGEVAGEAVVAGLDTRGHGPGELARAIAFVAQDPETQVVSTTVRAELELPLELRGVPSTARARAIEEAALALAIPELLDRTTDSLSGGELQRVALAAAVVGRPRLVLLDEPTSQLDPVAGDELISLLRRLNQQWGTSILLGEHRLERCLDAADRVVALAGGRIGFDGPPDRYLEWALAADPPLATPAARLFSLAGIRPLPVGVKTARRALAEHGLVPGGEEGSAAAATAERPAGRRERRFALRARGLRAELDAGEGPREALRGLDLEIAPGELVALMGRNGAGKSTLLRACAGLVEPSSGRIEVPGGCALLTQNPGDFLVHERVRDELPGDAGARALAEEGLDWAGERDPGDLSGGERQRLALAIALAGRGSGPAAAATLPALVCLDEPTRGMDRARKDELAARLRRFAAAGAALVVATHDVEFAAAFCERVILLGAGEAVADGSREEILSGGWYFATEVARVLDRPGAISAEEGAALLLGAAGRSSAPAGAG
jgi:energy-coupling factor transporter ATP-binding protein EcfA2